MWKDRTVFQKVVGAVVIFCSVLIIVLATLQLLGVWENAIYVYMPLMGIESLINGLHFRKTNPTVAVINLIAAGVILACTVVVLWVKL